MTTYKEKLEQSVKEYQPKVESLFEVPLGVISLEPFLNFVEDEDAIARVTPIRHGVIQYRASPSLDALFQSSVDYIAIHEMAHLADFIISPSSTIPRENSYVDESIADYATYTILGLFENPAKLREVRVGKIHTEQALFLKSHLDKFGVSFRDYVKNFNRIEGIWRDFEKIRG